MKSMFIQFPPVFVSLLVLSFLLTACQPGQEAKPLTLLSLFSDHMVLQQQEDVPIWGSYTPGEKVKITGSWGQEAQTKADEQGNWKIDLPTPTAGGPFTLTVKTGDSTLTLQDVMVGEVWLASGQSNMEMPLRGWPPEDPILNSAQEIAQANYPGIRMFTVERNLSLTPLDTVTGDWHIASPETAGDFSATAYFFARRLHQELGVPIGIIHSSWGGTVAEAWTSKERLQTLGDFDEALAIATDPSVQNEAEEWFSKLKTFPVPQTEVAWANMDLGDLAARQTDFQDDNWSEMALPARFDAFPSAEIDGVFWFRKKFQIADLSSDYLLSMGAIDDMEATYVNGQLIGSMLGAGKWNRPRSYVIPKSALVSGENTIALRVIDTGGGGCIGSPLEMRNASGVTVSLAGSWRYKVVAEEYLSEYRVYDLASSGFKERPALFQMHANVPTALFNAMLHPLIPYHIKGAIWYQGESNVGRADQYQRLFPAMIADWRSRWEKDFPFYYVQIAPFHYNGNPDPSTDVSQKLRDAQRLGMQTPNTGMVVTMDIGNFENIHPANKQDVGKRLAGWALAKDYGKEIVPSGPLYKSHEQVSNTLVLYFDYIGSGLTAAEGGLSGFEVAGADGVFMPAQAQIVGDKVQVSAVGVFNPVHARYAWRDDGVATLFNQENLPASCFKF